MLRRVCAVVVTAAALTVPAAASAASAATPVAGHLRVAIDTAAQDADFSQTAARSDVVVLQEWQYAKIRALKADKPGLKVLMYKNLSSIMSAENGNASTGVTAQEAQSHPEWYLLNTGGERFTFWAYDYLWAADIGNRDYQARWAENVLAKLQAHEWDGVLVDDANPTIRYHYDVESVARYPSDAAYGGATGSALAAIGPRLRAQGKLVIPNFGDWRRYRDTVGGWLGYVSGGMEEQFTKYGTSPSSGYFTGVDWEDQLAVLKQTQAMGKILLGVSHSDPGDDAAARYGWATMLLAADGSASFALHTNYSGETWFPEYDYDLGAPIGEEVEGSDGVHRRVFERGLVLVNPTLGSVPVNFAGLYRGSGLGTSAGTMMGPHTGLILLANGVPDPLPQLRPDPLPGQAAPAPSPSGGRDTAGAATIQAAGSRARRTFVVRVTCRSARRCRRLVTVLLGGRTVVGRRTLTVRAHRSARVPVRLNARGRSALAQRRRLRAVVRAPR